MPGLVAVVCFLPGRAPLRNNELRKLKKAEDSVKYVKTERIKRRGHLSKMV